MSGPATPIRPPLDQVPVPELVLRIRRHPAPCVVCSELDEAA